jgi:hypothetical protein
VNCGSSASQSRCTTSAPAFGLGDPPEAPTAAMLARPSIVRAGLFQGPGISFG